MTDEKPLHEADAKLRDRAALVCQALPRDTFEADDCPRCDVILAALRKTEEEARALAGEEWAGAMLVVRAAGERAGRAQVEEERPYPRFVLAQFHLARGYSETVIKDTRALRVWAGNLPLVDNPTAYYTSDEAAAIRARGQE